MKLPQRALRSILLLPDDFVGSLTVHSNGKGVYTIEVRHQQRFMAGDDQLVDFSPELHPSGSPVLRPPRR